MKTPEKPENFSYPCFAFLREDGSVYAVNSRWTTMEDFLAENRYKKDYSYGEILGIAQEHVTFTTFSHWSIPSGGSSSDAHAVWCHTSTYTIIKRFRVSRGGVLKAID